VLKKDLIIDIDYKIISSDAWETFMGLYDNCGPVINTATVDANIYGNDVVISLSVLDSLPDTKQFYFEDLPIEAS